ncbi:MAG TPA: MFS transporter [Pseudonocardiaceae bacterium]|nr:MFS transporter [Pseudonocardiaceae bacterium]
MTSAHGLPATHRRPTVRLPRPAAFWLLATTLLAFMFAAGAPSPLYVVYQAQWGFSATTLTTVFAVYAVALLIALVTVGALSDHVGRRPVLIAALIIEAAAMIVFIRVGDVSWLLVARAVQGFATGAATGTISAYLVDLAPPGNPKLGPVVNSTSPTLGLAVGALGSGVLVQYAPDPTTLVFVILTVVFVALALGAVLMPETVRRKEGALASLRPRVGVPARIRPRFAVAMPALISTWALGGLYLSLGPSLAAGVLHLRNHLVGGLVVAALCAAGSLSAFLVRDGSPRQLMIAGPVVLFAGVALTLPALAVTSTALFFTGAVVSGVGFGTSFLGAFRSLAGLARPDERAELFAAVYLVSYLAFSLPAIVAGVATTRAGLTATATGYGIVVMALALGAVAGLLVHGRVTRRAVAVTCPCEVATQRV